MKIIIAGDVSIMPDCEKLFAQRKTNILFNDVIKILKSADRTIVNLECAVTDKDTPIKKFGPNLKAPFGTIEVLKEAGVTDCCLSNNHILDFGKPGLIDTVSELKKNNISYTGIGENDLDARKDLIINDGKIKVAIINVCEHEYTYALENKAGARAYDPYDTADDIIAAKKNADYVVVVYHGGKEQCRYPSPRLLKMCRSMVNLGANVVLCQHSHCIGCYEQYQDGHIVYGQGNFHFITADYAKDTDIWNTGLITLIDFSNKCNIEFIPTVVEGKGIRLAKEIEKKKILEEMKLRSKSLQDGSWRERWNEFCNSATDYRIIPKEKEDVFAHFLDCEAHTDVLREIYQTWHKTIK